MERFSVRHGLVAFSNAGALRRSLIASGLAIFAVFFAASSATAATLNVSGGELFGASDVDVDGTLYDVDFVDGTCIALYSGCSVYPFPTQASAELASQALLDQVFLDVTAGDFDSNPALTNGCTNSSRCTVLTPYAITSSAGAANWSASSFIPDVVQDLYVNPQQDQSTVSRRTWAVWTVSTPIPEPGTALLLGLGLVALGSRRSREG